jgi:hypothetical protein
MISTGAAAAALLFASAFGAFAAPSAQGTEIGSGATLVQNAAPQEPSQATKPLRRKSSAHHHRGHKTALHGSAHRYKTSLRGKRTGAKALQKSARKTPTAS